jgi:hypothetical protein
MQRLHRVGIQKALLVLCALSLFVIPSPARNGDNEVLGEIELQGATKIVFATCRFEDGHPPGQLPDKPHQHGLLATWTRSIVREMSPQ